MNSAHCKRDQNELLKNIYRSAQKYRPNKNKWHLKNFLQTANVANVVRQIETQKSKLVLSLIRDWRNEQEEKRLSKFDSDFKFGAKMSGMRTGDVVVGDGTWNLTLFVTDLQVRRTKKLFFAKYF